MKKIKEFFRKFFRLFDFLTVNRYYRMDNHQLELEASKHHIGGYAVNGRVVRDEIIRQLLAKDNANNSRYAIAISVLALVISIIVALK
jgi:hypothetical protein